MIDTVEDHDAIKARMREMVDVFRGVICASAATGRMAEPRFVARDGLHAGHDPLSRLFGIMETRAAIRARGEGVSLRSGIGVRLYVHGGAVCHLRSDRPSANCSADRLIVR